MIEKYESLNYLEIGKEMFEFIQLEMHIQEYCQPILSLDVLSSYIKFSTFWDNVSKSNRAISCRKHLKS